MTTRRAALALAALLLAAACSTGHTSSFWKPCGHGYDCASLVVPLDHAAPTGATITLALVRHPASGHRLGALLVNPGGPGGSGVDFVKGGEPTSSALRKHYDIIGFDPRGVGASNPVKCTTDLDTFVGLDSSPDTPAEIKAYLDASKAFAASCAADSGSALLRHVSTADAARDMDLIRQALGEPVLDYLGYSYGTVLGATYAELFPSRVGKVVLDGVQDPAASAGRIELEQGVGFDKALDDFFADCAADASCPFTKDGHASLREAYQALTAQIDAHPLPAPHAPGHRMATPGLFALGTVAALYSKDQGWPLLRLALAEAQRGDGSTIVRLADVYDERSPDGSFTNILAAQLAVNCTDKPFPSIEDFAAHAAQVAKAAPIFGPTATWLDAPCLFWPAPATGRPHAVHVPAGTPPIVLIGTTNDPATPYSNAVAVSREITGSVLLTYVGDGHTAFGTSPCIDALVEAFFVDAKVPAPTTCH